MRRVRLFENARCYHLISRLVHLAFPLDDDEKAVERILALLKDGLMKPSAIRKAIGINSSVHFNRYYISPMLSQGLIARMDPEHPQSPQQKYMLP